MKIVDFFEAFFWVKKIEGNLKKETLDVLLKKIIYENEKKPLNRLNSERNFKEIYEKKIMKKLFALEDACIYSGFNAKCLHRTIIQYKWFRGDMGYPVKFVIGVKKFPFQSHAWVVWKEDNTSFCDSKENIRGYDIIFDSDIDYERL